MVRGITGVAFASVNSSSTPAGANCVATGRWCASVAGPLTSLSIFLAPSVGASARSADPRASANRSLGLRAPSSGLGAYAACGRHIFRSTRTKMDVVAAVLDDLQRARRRIRYRTIAVFTPSTIKRPSVRRRTSAAISNGRRHDVAAMTSHSPQR
jgi:hypothetical protein